MNMAVFQGYCILGSTYLCLLAQGSDLRLGWIQAATKEWARLESSKQGATAHVSKVIKSRKAGPLRLLTCYPRQI